MIYIALLVYTLGMILDIGGLLVSVQCANKRKFLTLGKLALALCPFGEKIAKVGMFLLMIGIVDKMGIGT